MKKAAFMMLFLICVLSFGIWPAAGQSDIERLGDRPGAKALEIDTKGVQAPSATLNPDGFDIVLMDLYGDYFYLNYVTTASAYHSAHGSKLYRGKMQHYNYTYETVVIYDVYDERLTFTLDYLSDNVLT